MEEKKKKKVWKTPEIRKLDVTRTLKWSTPGAIKTPDDAPKKAAAGR